MVTPNQSGGANPGSGANPTEQRGGNFVVVYGDPGSGEHSVGSLFRLAAETHVDEIKKNKFPGVPHFDEKKSHIYPPIHVNTVQAFAASVTRGDVLYLAYFGHSWAGDIGERRSFFDPRNPSATDRVSCKFANSWGLLLIGDGTGAGTNLGDPVKAKVISDNYEFTPFAATPATVIPRSKFLGHGAQVRLFGCRGAYGNNSAAEQIARNLKIQTFGYSNSGGSLFTADEKLGHGLRVITEGDRNARLPSKKPIWLITSNGGQSFKEFSGK